MRRYGTQAGCFIALGIIAVVAMTMFGMVFPLSEVASPTYRDGWNSNVVSDHLSDSMMLIDWDPIYVSEEMPSIGRTPEWWPPEHGVLPSAPSPQWSTLVSSRPATSRHGMQAPFQFDYLIEGFGWPFIWIVIEQESTASYYLGPAQISRGLLERLKPWPPRTTISFPRLVGNVAAWTTAIGIMASIRHFTIAYFRTKAGRCKYCGYPQLPLHTSGSIPCCPECGRE